MADLKILPDRLQHFQSVHFRHHLIGHYDVRMIQMHFLQSFYAVIGYMDIEFIFQLQFYQVGTGLYYPLPAEESVMKHQFPVPPPVPFLNR